MFYYLKDGDPEIDGMLRSVCETGGEARQITDFSISFRDWPETQARAEESVATAKRRPRSERHRNTKKLVYRVQYNRFRRLFETEKDAVAVAWNGITGTRRAFMAAAADAGRPRLYLERAPLPGRVTVDPVGINQLNMLPRDPQAFRDWGARDPSRTGRDWLRLREIMTARKSKRADVGQSEAEAAYDGPFLFCPLQVPDDTQIRQFAGWVRDIEHFIDLLAQACRHLPEGWTLRVKEHPSSKIPLGEALAAAQTTSGSRLIIDNQTDTFQQVAASHGVVTLNSSVGLQAFFYEKPVIVLGEAFFRMPGLVHPADTADEFNALFAKPDGLGYDADLRNAFMTYLDQVYYPKVEKDSGGDVRVLPDLVRPKIDAALHGAATALHS